ncbi:hypothetical protein A3Q56_04268 [Intoshia linei]|uniref:glutamine--tRNA ligase n=1 Tax=Intoshia linei TaxID=1819745 RepID=A0A177B1C1_9BILA|nr:hypothetical protein A3Q56_04268 [Intoshia linei]
MNKIILVGCFNPETTEAQIKHYFQKFGTVDNVSCFTEKNEILFAKIEFNNDESRLKTISKNLHVLKDYLIIAKSILKPFTKSHIKFIERNWVVFNIDDFDIADIQAYFSSISQNTNFTKFTTKKSSKDGFIYTFDNVSEMSKLSLDALCPIIKIGNKKLIVISMWKFALFNNLIVKILESSLDNINEHRHRLFEYIVNRNISNETQLRGAISYIRNIVKNKKEFIVCEFDQLAGRKQVPSFRVLEICVVDLLKKNCHVFDTKRSSLKIPVLVGEVKKRYRFCDFDIVKDLLMDKIIVMYGPINDDELKEKNVKEQKSNNVKIVSKDSLLIEFDVGGEAAHFHKPGGNEFTSGYIKTLFTDGLMKDHLNATGGKVITRFPPEPNGLLHIGHAKAINLNFSYAKHTNGHCYLRYDDTNPCKEEKRFVDEIFSIVKWLGFEPYKVTHASDNFEKLYEYAVLLIKKKCAYICHQKAEETQGMNNKNFSPWRDRPIYESLKLFQDMRNGKFLEGEICLRLKHTMKDGKVDPVAYRIIYFYHPKSKNQWCIYPTYDYAHCLCDSIENITHSMCTKEFQNRRPSYYWLCNAVGIYCPVQWEYSRLNIEYTVLSKRKIKKLIDKGIVADWDDPRLFTLSALRRRGVPPQAILNFVNLVGITMAENTIDVKMLNHCTRIVLDAECPRLMVVINPLKIKITNYKEATSWYTENDPNEVSLIPVNSMKNNIFKLTPEFYIDQDDFYENNPSKDYRRGSLTQSVGLMNSNLVLIPTNIEQINSEKIIICKLEKLTSTNKPKCFIHWINSDCQKVTCRFYSNLFNDKIPDLSNEGLKKCNENSLTIFTECLYPKNLIKHAEIGERFQFMRIGYFVVDPDTQNEKIVFNRIIELKESKNKSF